MFLTGVCAPSIQKANLNSCSMLQQDEIPIGFFVSDQLLEKLTNRVSTKSQRERDSEKKNRGKECQHKKKQNKHEKLPKGNQFVLCVCVFCVSYDTYFVTWFLVVFHFLEAWPALSALHWKYVL